MSIAATDNAGFEARIDAVVDVFSRRALNNPRLAWALLAEPVDPLVDAERLDFRRRYRDLIAGLVSEGIAEGTIPEQDVGLTASALVGAIGEALVGPLSPVGGAGMQDDEIVAALIVFCRRAAGVNGN
jgi:AcrR family transcriptional regulator